MQLQWEQCVKNEECDAGRTATAGVFTCHVWPHLCLLNYLFTLPNWSVTEICHVDGSVHHKEHEIAGDNRISDKRTTLWFWKLWRNVLNVNNLFMSQLEIIRSDASLQSRCESTTQLCSHCGMIKYEKNLRTFYPYVKITVLLICKTFCHDAT